jgi:hypothetical protein
MIIIAGCRIPEHPQDVTISKAPVFRPSSPKEINNIEQALAAIITVCKDDIGLPVTDPLYVHLYKNSASFAFYGYGWRTLPFDVANQEAFARKNEIHIDLGKVGTHPWGNSARLLAHEYAHTIEYQIGNPGRGSAFIAEGFAEWVALKVLHYLKWQDYSITLHQANREVARQWNVLPSIQSLQNNQVWIRTLEQPNGLIMTYTVAFLAIDKLVHQKGLTAVNEYVSKGTLNDDLITWLDDLNKLVSETTPPSKGGFSFVQPDWKIGYKWTYLKTSFGSSTKIVKEIIGEDMYRGTPVFVLRTGEEETFYGKEGMGFVASRRNGEIVSDVDKSYPFFSWPLEPGKESRVSFTQRNLANNSTTKDERIRFVTGIEEITVPAGHFDAVKVESYVGSSGHLRGEYWYSPKVKWFVKTRIYSDVGVTEEELAHVELKESKPPVS